ncbi:MAG: hypothetical protein K0Q66_1605 [Chitinophagaceae bacterium]|nr:hypothetical protein [Chitinophagaceae bacterium]
MKKLLPLLIVFLTACKDDAPSEKRVSKANVPEQEMLQRSFVNRIDSLIPLAITFTRQGGYNTDVAFIADLSLHSGLPRMAVVDLARDTIIHQGMIAHGAGGKYWSKTARFSNTPNSLCSSPGKYRIGMKYNGRFGKAYKLHGLDKSNSKAFDRFIVLHAYECVPDTILYPDYLCNSEGCPMVSHKFLDTLSSYIDKTKLPVLLWIVGDSGTE